METLEQIKADAVEVFHFDRECRPQDRAHATWGSIASGAATTTRPCRSR